MGIIGGKKGEEEANREGDKPPNSRDLLGSNFRSFF